jgi:lysophospholipase L1-like esterase
VKTTAKTPARVWAGRLLVLVMGCLLALLVLEVALRVHDPFGFRVRGNRIILPRYRKYTIRNTQFPKLDPVIHHTKNSLGFRGPEPPADFTNVLTVFAVGGSTTESYELSDGDDWPNVLRFWMNNAGLNGHSSFGHLILLESFLLPMKPKVVLFLAGANDVGRASMRPHDEIILGRDARGSALRSAVKRAAARSLVASAALNFIRYREAVELGVVERKYIDLATWSTNITVTAALRDATLARHRQYLPGYRERILRLIALCRRNGAEPVFVTQPALYGPATDPVTGRDLGALKMRDTDGTLFDGRLAWEREELYNDIVRQAGRDEGVMVVDLARSLPKSWDYFYDWVHFTPEGSREVARLIHDGLAPHLRERFPQYVAPGATP